MKDIFLSWLFLLAAGLLVLFGAFAFVDLSFNPGTWPHGDRALLSIFSIGWLVFVTWLAINKVPGDAE